MIDLDATGATFGSLFNASAVSPGTYQFRYLLEGTIGCSSDSATVTVTTVAAPNAGCNGTAGVLLQRTSGLLIDYLGCSPSPGGIWTRPGNHPFSGLQSPDQQPRGLHLSGSGQWSLPGCDATVTVSETLRRMPGTQPPYEVCETDAGFNMTGPERATPRPRAPGPTRTGSRTDPPSQPDWTSQEPISTRSPVGSPVPPDITPPTVVVNDAANAGGDASVTVCSDDPPFPGGPIERHARPGRHLDDPNGDPLLGGTIRRARAPEAPTPIPSRRRTVQ